MTPDDPRHGSEAGHEQHNRDGEEPCGACTDAKLRAARRRTKRKTMGYRYTLPLGDLHGVLVGWRDGSASLDDIGLHVAMETSQIWRMLRGGPEGIVYARTFKRVADAADTFPLTTIGVTRRIQALNWLGYSTAAIAEASGVHHDTILDARDKAREFVAQKVKVAVADGYDRLHMAVPSGETKQQRAGITRVRNAARRKGWLPPLAWTNIDDGNERPTGWEFAPAERADALRDLAERGFGITEACRRLHLGRGTLQKWCSNNGMSDLYRQLVAREGFSENQHMREAS